MISTVDTAKLVRQTLVNTFGKATKFSVRSEHYTSIRVNWTDGPTDAEVEHAIGHYCAGSFDSMTDCFQYDDRPYANRYIFTSRHESLAVWETVKDLLIAEYPQVITEGFFSLEYGSHYSWQPDYDKHTSGIDWNRIYRRAVSSYDASTGQFIYTDILHAYSTPDNWQYHGSPDTNEKDPLERLKDDLNAEGLRLANLDESGWLYPTFTGEKVWVTSLGLGEREAFQIGL